MLRYHQNLMYKADIISKIAVIRTIDVGWILNISGFSEKAFAFIFDAERLINTITTTVIKNDHPMQMKKGIS